jgi:hypothetical protein
VYECRTDSRAKHRFDCCLICFVYPADDMLNHIDYT